MRDDHAIFVGLETIVSYWCSGDGVNSIRKLFFASNFVIALLQAINDSDDITALYWRSAVLNLGSVRIFANQW